MSKLAHSNDETMRLIEARDVLRHCNGLHVGMLEPHEMEAFDELCRAGEAHRSYEGAGGFMGLARVRIATPSL